MHAATHQTQRGRGPSQTVDSLKIPEALLKISTVIAVTGLSESSIRRKMAAGDFPLPVRDGLRCTRWIAAEVQAWLRARQAQRDAA
ncbi:helix-turn-helix transcriptional regulator [Ottowia testudinis]|uniref:helix-turn-helix transcriptional regulator n=1 Tax=Ottowia testudinis TaxID=2816950 RepID=UPI001FB0B83A|nr:AlpA family phage regulatory protein [Ottowia testudinis]